jgi:hypothetical protein
VQNDAVVDEGPNPAMTDPKPSVCTRALVSRLRRHSWCYPAKMRAAHRRAIPAKGLKAGCAGTRAVSEHGVIIVSNGPAGVAAAAAESSREHDTFSAARILTADPALRYARPPLSTEYLRGQIDDVGLHPRR